MSRTDGVLDRTTADEMIERFASASLVKVGGGHDLAVECPADVGRLIGAFLAATGALDRSR